MSHVDEGTLHSYLDGELPSGERAAVDAHIAQCVACRARLGEERALLERASALLGSTRPIERAAPPFEQVRRAPRRRPWHVRTPVAWAASIVLALGVGYYLAGPMARETQMTPSLEQRTAATPASDSLPAEALAAAAPRRPNTSPAPSNESAAVGGYRRGADSALTDALALQSRVQLRNTAPVQAALGQVRQKVADSLAALEEASIIADGAPVAAAAPRFAERDRREGAAASATRARRDDGRSVRNLVATSWPIISRGVAASMLGDKPVGVPGLATRQIRRNPTGDGTVVVEQALDSSTVIQIFQRPASVVENADSTARFYAREWERADRVLSRYVGRLRVEISGPVSTDSLNRLLEQVEPIP